MRSTRFSFFAASSLALLLQACASTPPVEDSPPVEEKKPAPEITLNLPEQVAEACNCAPEPAVDLTFLNKGLRALAAGDHREAVNYFRRYQRLESSPVADWEAEIAVAYDKMLPQSPYYNPGAATDSYQRLMRRQPEMNLVHENIVLMRDALAQFVLLNAQIDDVQNENDLLSENLEKREEALKRLRELTLGQRGAAQ